MRFPSCSTLSSNLLVAATLTSAFPLEDRKPLPDPLHKRQEQPSTFALPAEVTGLKTITTDRGISIRYKEPGKDAGVCETTPDVNSYSGYIDLAEDVHVFFWFFESRRDPANDDLTLCM